MLRGITKKIEKKNYKDVSIHLDLTESEEISIVNEFFSHFLLLDFILIMKILFIYLKISKFFLKYQIVLSIIYQNLVY